MSGPGAPAPVAGLLLAAGAGRRMGRPKALVRTPDGEPWLRRAVALLHAGGCPQVTVVLGAAAEEAGALLEGLDVAVVHAEDWAEGMSASLRAGLGALAGAAEPAEAALVTLVDLPDLVPEVVARVAAVAGPGVLARAAYRGVPGHPVLLGREHWTAVARSADGDSGAKGYLAGRDVVLVECGDLATGRDVDQPSPH